MQSCPKAAQTAEVENIIDDISLCLLNCTNYERTLGLTFRVSQPFHLYFTAVSERGDMNVFMK